MPIFRISGKRIQKVKPTKFLGADGEKQLQKLIENNLDAVFEMTFIGSEFSTTHGGRIDTLAIDNDKRPVIIEYKPDKSSTILLQGLYYMDWLVENKAEFEKLMRLKLKRDIPVNWKSGVRLILIAKNFEIWDKFAVNRLKEEVELYEYVLYENNELKLEKTALPKDFRTKPKTSITSTIEEYTVDYHMKKIKNTEIKNMVNQLRETIKSISDDIEERTTKDHIIFKSTVNFAAIYTQIRQFWFDVKLPRNELEGMKELDVRPHKDEVFTHIRCNEKTNLKLLLSLAKRAYENTL